MPGDQPFDFRNSAIQSTSGVLLLPPTVRLPTTITRMPGAQDSQPVQDPAAENDDAKQKADRPQQPGDGAAAIPVPHYLADCVVKVSCVRPASRDASITRTTA